MGEFESRDPNVCLTSTYLLATFDQHSTKVRGKEVGAVGACAFIAANVAEWLLMYHPRLPSLDELENLTLEGGHAWTKMRPLYSTEFPDGHFELGAALGARREMRALRGTLVLAGSEQVACFEPKLQNVGTLATEGADQLRDQLRMFLHDVIPQTFEGMWEEVEKMGNGVRIIAWNDHYFVLLVRDNYCMLFDSMGSRLTASCTSAYVLCFDDEFRLYRKMAARTAGGPEGREHVCNPDSTPMQKCASFIRDYLAAPVVSEIDTDLANAEDVDAATRRVQVAVYPVELTIETGSPCP